LQTVDFSDLTDSDMAVLKKNDVINPALKPGEVGYRRPSAVPGGIVAPSLQAPLMSDAEAAEGDRRRESRTLALSLSQQAHSSSLAHAPASLPCSRTYPRSSFHFMFYLPPPPPPTSQICHRFCEWIAQVSHSHPAALAVPFAGPSVVETRFRKQEGFWGEVDATYQAAWYGDASPLEVDGKESAGGSGRVRNWH
jgi:hypothetical protein